MLHTVVRKYKTAEKYPSCENRQVSQCFMYAIILCCLLLFPSLLSFVIAQPLLRCVIQKVAQSAPYNATRQNMLQHLYILSTECEKTKLHHDRLYCDMKTQDQMPAK
jgi:hypothetical protein